MVIAIATLLLVYIASGYDIDRDTGEVIQNGLVFVDSKPVQSEIYLNGEKQNGKTDARIVVPAGEYKVELISAGYRSWTKSLILEGGKLRSLTYARLIPEILSPVAGPTLRSNPASVSQSIDRRWIVLTHNDSPLIISVIDTELEVPNLQNLSVPAALISGLPTSGSIEVIEWASDNSAFLAKYSYPEGFAYLLVDRQNPARSINLTTTLSALGAEISLLDRKKSEYFVYTPQTKILTRASFIGGVAKSELFLSNVVAYKAFQSDWVLYITSSVIEGHVEARFRRDEQDILLKNLTEDETYLLALAKLEDSPVIGLGSPKENRVILYTDPQKYLDNNEFATIPVAETVLRINNPQELIISADASTVAAHSGSEFVSHEFDADRSYSYTISTVIDATQKLRWMDGQHLVFASGGIQYICDYDGNNVYELVAGTSVFGSYFSNNYETMYTLSVPPVDTAVSTPTSPALFITSLVAL